MHLGVCVCIVGMCLALTKALKIQDHDLFAE